MLLKRKNQVCLLLLSAVLISAGSKQNTDLWRVIKVNGVVTLDNKIVMKNDTMNDTDKLIFGDKESCLRLWRPRSGFRTAREEKQEGKPSGLLVELKKALVPNSEYSYAGTKSIQIQTFDRLRDYLEYSGETSRHVFIERAELRLNPEVFRLDSSRYLDLVYTYRGEVIRSPLKYIENTLYLDSTIYSIRGEMADLAEIEFVDLIYIDRIDGVKATVASFKPYFWKREDVIKEVEVVREFTSLDKVPDYFWTYYGRIEFKQIAKLLKEEYDFELR